MSPQKKSKISKLESPEFYRKIKLKDLSCCRKRDISSSLSRKDLNEAKQILHSVLIDADFSLI